MKSFKQSSNQTVQSVYSHNSDHQLQTKITATFLTGVITACLQQQAVAMAAIWEKELIQRCHQKQCTSIAINTIITYLSQTNQNEGMNGIEKQLAVATQVMYTLEEVKEYVINWSLLHGVIEIMRINEV